MDKSAATQVRIHDLLARRWSPRAFDERLVESGTVASLFEAARWAPSSSNEQPWRFIVGIKGKGENHQKIYNSLVEFNQLC